MTLATISYLCPLAMVTKKPMHVITTLYVSTLVTLVAVLTTSLGECGSVCLPHHCIVIPVCEFTVRITRRRSVSFKTCIKITKIYKVNFS